MDIPRRSSRSHRRRLTLSLLGICISVGSVGLWTELVSPSSASVEYAFTQRTRAQSLTDLPSRGGELAARLPTGQIPQTRAAASGSTATTVAAGETENVPAPAPPPPKISSYQVQSGDTVSSIAASFGLKTETVLWANALGETSLLQLGQALRIPAKDGLLHKIGEGDTLWDLATRHRVELDSIILANPDVEPGALQLGQLLLIPGARPGVASGVASGVAAAAAAPAVPTSISSFDRWPVQGPITSRYGWRIHPVYGSRAWHEGLDVGAPTGTPIRAVAAGRVTLSEWFGGWGLSVKVDHGNELATRYSHASVLLVKPGEWVEAGQVVAQVGSTGISTGPHLDFGVYVGNRSQDPLAWLP